MQPPTPAPKRPTTWIVLTGGLLAAVIGLAIWAAVLQRDHGDVNAKSAARIDDLEQQNADLEQQVGDLQQQLSDEQAAAESAAADAQSELEAAGERYDAVSAELGAANKTLEESQAELERLAAEAEDALAQSEGATASAEERADAQKARADLAEACLAAVADVLGRLYESDDPVDGLEQAAEDLEGIAEECAPTE